MSITMDGVELGVQISEKAAEKIKYFAEKEGIESARLLVGGHPHLEVLESQCINLTRTVEKYSRKNILFISMAL